jgi:hypothetical protein
MIDMECLKRSSDSGEGGNTHNDMLFSTSIQANSPGYRYEFEVKASDTAIDVLMYGRLVVANVATLDVHHR